MTRPVNILLANRANAFALSGGDTALMGHLISGLRARGHQVETTVSAATLQQADLVHIVNLTIRESVAFADAALECKKPYVITTLFEDWPCYLNKSLQSIASFHRYLVAGQPREVLREELVKIKSLKGGPRLERQEVVEQAALLLACGESEARRLRTAFPGCDERIMITPFGADGLPAPRLEDFASVKKRVRHDVFVLCCGRLETRKNQLMLLAALENADLPIVFAAGSGSVQPVYVDLVRRFRRHAPTIILDKLDGRELAALMSLAAVHVLPSWFELPGLVTLEAQHARTPVVASEWGAIRDYLTVDQCAGCQPDDPDSIRDAITRAIMDKPARERVVTAALPLWSDFVEATLAGYRRALHIHAAHRRSLPCLEHHTSSYTTVSESSMNSTAKSAFRFDVSIIIPCFNRAQLTKECVEALCANDPVANYEVIFVDNGSTDETVQVLKAIEGDIKVVRFNQNRGFAAACNQAACLAEGRYLVFLNNDTQPMSGWLDELIATVQRYPDAGAVGSLLLYPDGTVQHAGIAVNERNVPYHIFQNFATTDAAVKEERQMLAVTGACMLVPTELYRQLGGFDEAYTNGFEDVDFCLRLKEAGYCSVFSPRSKVMHHEESSEGRKTNDRANFERFMNRWGASLTPDETTIANRYGYRIEWTESGGKYYRMEVNSSPQAKAPVDADQLLAEAQTLYTNGKFDEAAATLQNVVQNSVTLAGDNEFEAWQTLGNCFTRLNRAAEAEGAFSQAIKLNSDSERPYLGLGTLAMIEENWLAAQYSFMTALAKNPEATKGEFGVGLSLAARNRHEAALDRFARVLAKEPLNAEALFYYYRSSMEANKPEQAIPALETFVAAHPTDANFMFHLCGAYWKTGRVLNAIEMCEKVLKLDPTHSAANDILKHFEQTLAVNA